MSAAALLLRAPDARPRDRREDRTLSLARDLYLDSHRLGGTPYVPMAMLVEWLCEQAAATSRVVVDELVCRQPLFLRRDRDRRVLSVTRREDDGTTVLRLFDDEERTYAEGRLRPETPRERMESWRPRPDGGGPAMHLGRALYRRLLPHGPHFQCDLALTDLDAEGLRAELSGFDERIEFLPSRRLADLRCHPAGLDAALQLCAVHHALQAGRLALPVGLQGLRLDLAALPAARTLRTEIRRLRPQRYGLTVWGASGAVVASCGGIDFAPAGPPVDPEVLEDLHVPVTR